MQIILVPVSGAAVVSVRIEAQGLIVDGSVWPYDALPAEGRVRAGDEVVTVEYGEHGGVNTCQLTNDHTVRIIAPNLPAPPPPLVDKEAEERAELAAQRAGWVVDRWQIKTVLGRDLWQVIEDFGGGESASWGLKTVIEDATTIPRVSQTVDLLAFILGLTEGEVDELFRQAMTLTA